MPALLALLLLIGGGVTAASEQSVPGDLLYPVKINFNERVRSILAVTDQDDARWETEAAERRLSEAELLTERGTLDEVTRTTLENEFADHVNQAEERTTKLVAAGELAAASDITVNLEAALSAHQRIIADLTVTTTAALAATTATSTTPNTEGVVATSTDNGTRNVLQKALSELGKLSQKVGDKLEEVAVSREAVDVQLLTAADRQDEAQTLARNREKSAEDRLLTVRGHLQTHRLAHGSGSGTEAEARLLAADNALDRGRVAIGDKDFTNAYHRYQEAIKEALAADAFLRTEKEKYTSNTGMPALGTSPASVVPQPLDISHMIPLTPTSVMVVPDGTPGVPTTTQVAP